MCATQRIVVGVGVVVGIDFGVVLTNATAHRLRSLMIQCVPILRFKELSNTWICVWNCELHHEQHDNSPLCESNMHARGEVCERAAMTNEGEKRSAVHWNDPHRYT